MKTLRLHAPEPTEHELQTALLRRLTRAGWVAIRLNSGARKTAAGGYFRAYFVAGLNVSAGVADVLAWKGSEYRFYEVKQRGGELSDSQIAFRDYAAARGVCVEVVEGLAELEALKL